MSQPAKLQEPSMEEILASIRRIIADDDSARPPPVPAAKTSAVPLKKETVRITLRARPGAGVTQPKELSAPVPAAPGTAPVRPGSPRSRR